MRNSLRTVLIVAGAVTLIGAGAGAAQAASVLVNGSFEAPNLGATNYEYPGVLLDNWTYGGSALVNASAGSAWYIGSAPAGQDGVQFAALQGGSSLSQIFTADNSSMDLSWLNAGRSDFGAIAGNQTYEVQINGVTEGTYSTTSGAPFSLENLDLTGLTSGTQYTLTFQGLATTDQTAFIDGVQLSAVPEPAAWAMMLAGFFGLGALLRGRHSQALQAA